MYIYIYIHTQYSIYIYDNVCMSSLYEVLCRSGVGVSELKGVRGFGRCRVHGVFMVVTDIAYIHVLF